MTPSTHTALALAAVLCAPTAFAQHTTDGMKGMDMPKNAAPHGPVTHHAFGVVREVDAQAGVVTFAHEAVPSMKWPAMTMGFQVRDKTMLEKLSVGQKVGFDFIQEAKGFVVTAIKPGA